jgi:hypothetical protein
MSETVSVSSAKLEKNNDKSNPTSSRIKDKNRTVDFNKFVIKKIKLHNKKTKKLRHSSVAKLRPSMFSCFTIYIVNLTNLPGH